MVTNFKKWNEIQSAKIWQSKFINGSESEIRVMKHKKTGLTQKIWDRQYLKTYLFSLSFLEQESVYT